MSLFDIFDFTKNLVASLGYFGVFLGVFLEGVFPPIPSEVIMGFSGFLISEGRFSWFGVILAALLGNFLSVSLIWFLGKKFGKPLLVKWGRFIGVGEKDLELGKKLFQKYGYWVVFACQMLPLARTLIAFPAGILETKYPRFMLANCLGAAIWFSFLTYIGFIFGQNWENIENILKPFERVILVIFVGLFLFWVAKTLKSFRSKNAKV